MAMTIHPDSNDAASPSSNPFRHVLPASRLGQDHESLESFTNATLFTPTESKEYSLVLVTEPPRRRILIGLKHRGFGKGMYTSFGGKIEQGETHVESASRELEEETGLCVPISVMEKCKIGVLRFTFDDSSGGMLVHLFRVNVSCSPNNKDPNLYQINVDDIRGCDEISPRWLDDWHDIPLDNMFADDSLWLTKVLSSTEDICLDGHFHFKPGGQKINTIQHYHMTVRSDKTPVPRTLEQRLFHAIHSNGVSQPSIKEFKEAYAFANSVRKMFGKDEFDVVIDVAGGNGVLAAIFLMTTTTPYAVVIDPAIVGKRHVKNAWGAFYRDKTLQYRHECLRTGLPDALSQLLKTLDKNRILVVACHACQHLSDEVLAISCKFGVHSAVLPCCQKDSSTSSSWKATSKNLALPFAKVMDLLLAGKAMSWGVGRSADVTYDVRMMTIDSQITPQNRIILCRANYIHSENDKSTSIIAAAHKKLQRAYNKAHANTRDNTEANNVSNAFCRKSFAWGFAACLLITLPLLLKKNHGYACVGYDTSFL